MSNNKSKPNKNTANTPKAINSSEPKKVAKPTFPTNQVIVEGKMSPEEVRRAMAQKSGSNKPNPKKKK